MAFFHADGDFGSAGFDSATKGFDAFEVGASPVKTFYCVVGNEIDLGSEFFGVFGEESGLGKVVVDSVNENVLEGDDLLALVDESFAGLKEFFDWIPLIDRHDLLAGFVIGSVERDGKTKLGRMFSQLEDAGNEAAGGEGDVAGSDPETFRGENGVQGWQQVGEVGQGFDHAHEDEVVDPATCFVSGHEDLPYDFSGSEVSLESIQPAGTEFAAQGTPHLRGNTESQSVCPLPITAWIGWNENTFDVLAIGESPEEFPGSVFGALKPGQFHGLKLPGFRKLFPHGAGQITHLMKIHGTLFKDPLADLLGPKVWSPWELPIFGREIE